IISQGKVEEILSNKSGDRRVALEEAAGVMRYRQRKEEAARKLDHTEKNMERIADILHELEDRLEPLSEQSEKARAYFGLREELRDLDVNIFLYQFERQKERLATLKTAITEAEGALSVNEAADGNLLSACHELEETLRNLDASLSAQQNALMRLLAGVESHVGESNVLLERRTHAQTEILRIAEESRQTEEQISRLAEQAATLSQTTEKTGAQAILDKQLADTQQQLAVMDTRVQTDEATIETMKNSIMEAMNRLSDARSSLSRFEAMIAALADRQATLSNDKEKVEHERKLLGQESQEMSEALSALQNERAETERNNIEARIRQSECETAFQANQGELQASQQALGALESRLHVLREMIKSREGYQNSVRFLMRDVEQTPTLNKKMHGLVTELLRVPKEYEAAVSTALGGAMQNIVTPTAEDAKDLIEHLRRNDYGRVTFLPLSLITPHTLSEKDRALLKENGCLGLASELIGVKDGLQKVCDYLLGRTVIVRDLDAGIALKKKSQNSFHIATLQGDYISTGGTMTGGSAGKRSLSLLGREREVQELEKSCKEKQAACAKLEKQTEEIKQNLLLCGVQVDAFAQALLDLDIGLAKQQEKAELLSRDTGANARRLEEIAQTEQDIAESMAELQVSMSRSQESQTELEQSNVASREDVIAAQKQLTTLKQEREVLAATLTEQKVARMALQKEEDARQNELARLTRERGKLESQMQNLLAQRDLLHAQSADIDAQLAAREQDLSGEQAEVQAARREQERLEEERRRVSAMLAQHREERDGLRGTYRDMGERKHKNELAVSRIEMELNATQDRIWQEYELTYENARALRREIPIGATNARITELRAEIRELGEINPTAIEDYVAVSARHEGLKRQFDDLTQAKEDLGTLIGQLTRTMEEMFREEFTKVQANFTEVFAKLFGGGQAELRLADPKDVLNCDIDIIAQPPGKKLQLLSLLSGGERALTAIALLFAMLQVKAPAFCVLDEIETSLDEINVSRFARFLQDYSQNTQFILITHRKGSMELCDTLYGVAMEEKGVSTIVSAKFGEAG
ncbi:MAG: chromosome segregation protein SMC, partial [Clostridiales bacterium]|nr:chromosome segregation protein SMC [Clostridiales bacterium]